MPTKNNIQLLIAQDEKFWVDFVKLRLDEEEKKPFSVDWVNNGEVAVKKAIADKADYDAILMNLEMPLMDGLIATRKIREAGSNIPIIAWTCHLRACQWDVCQAAGMNEFIEINAIRLLEDITSALKECAVIT